MSDIIDYKQAGVDIEAGDQLVSWLKSNQPNKWPHQERIVSSIGGFSALFRADFTEMKKPCLVSATDGVGTKLKWAIELGSFKEVAQDLVAMCVNDLICCGAEPLFFLDYYATGKLELDKAKEFLGGVQSACIESNCALIGGETAEMPGMYKKNDFDCAGFAVGVVDEEKVLGSHRVKPGAKLIGVSSSGFHSNGFSLLRKLFDDDFEEWGSQLIVQTHLYVKFAKSLISKMGEDLWAMAHITGGGMDNLARVLPKNTKAEILPWELKPIYKEAQRRSGLDFVSLSKTFNCGIGLVLVVDPSKEKMTMDEITAFGFDVISLGQVSKTDIEEPHWEIVE